jgi:broad specificity phosphatase PhoE
MLNVLLVRPGSTTFDEEGRIKGALDIPLSPLGERQSAAAGENLKDVPVECLYVAPCESAQATGKILARLCGWKSRTIDCFRNVNQGLWQGKLVDEVRRLQPRVYKQFHDNPVGICPPSGEMLDSALQRVESTLDKLVRRHRSGTIAMVIPEPMASVVRCHLLGCDFGDIWTSQLDAGTWELLTLHQPVAAAAV